MADSEKLVSHRGGCHCGAVRWQVQAPANILALDCNCSICKKKANLHFIVPASRFKLIKGEENLTTYTFNTHIAKHTFCKTCGVQSFYHPRSNPDGYGVNPRCIDPPDTVESVTLRKVDGSNWETAIAQDHTIAKMSKE